MCHNSVAGLYPHLIIPIWDDELHMPSSRKTAQGRHLGLGISGVWQQPAADDVGIRKKSYAQLDSTCHHFNQTGKYHTVRIHLSDLPLDLPSWFLLIQCGERNFYSILESIGKHDSKYHLFNDTRQCAF